MYFFWGHFASQDQDERVPPGISSLALQNTGFLLHFQISFSPTQIREWCIYFFTAPIMFSEEQKNFVRVKKEAGPNWLRIN